MRESVVLCVREIVLSLDQPSHLSFGFVKGIYSEAEIFHGDSFYQVSDEKGQLPGDTCLPLTHGTANPEDSTKKLLECRPDTRPSPNHPLPTLQK